MFGSFGSTLDFDPSEDGLEELREELGDRKDTHQGNQRHNKVDEAGDQRGNHGN